MPLLAADVQKRILERTGDFDPTTGDPVVGGGGYLEQQIAGVWAQYADKAYIAPRLVELYTERDLFDRAIALLQDRFDFSDEQSSFKRSQRVQTLVDRRDKVIEKIGEVESMIAANRAGAVGTITTTAPFGPPLPFPNGLDANNPRYGGNPYYRKPWNYP